MVGVAGSCVVVLVVINLVWGEGENGFWMALAQLRKLVHMLGVAKYWVAMATPRPTGVLFSLTLLNLNHFEFDRCLVTL